MNVLDVAGQVSFLLKALAAACIWTGKSRRVG